MPTEGPAETHCLSFGNGGGIAVAVSRVQHSAVILLIEGKMIDPFSCFGDVALDLGISAQRYTLAHRNMEIIGALAGKL